MVIRTSRGSTTYSEQYQLWDQTLFLGFYPAGPLKSQRIEPVQPLRAACSSACLPSWSGEGFLYLHSEPPLFELRSFLSHPPTMQHSETLLPSSLKPPHGRVQTGCSDTSSPKPFVLQAEDVPVPGPLFTGQVLL